MFTFRNSRKHNVISHVLNIPRITITIRNVDKSVEKNLTRNTQTVLILFTYKILLPLRCLWKIFMHDSFRRSFCEKYRRHLCEITRKKNRLFLNCRLHRWKNCFRYANCRFQHKSARWCQVIGNEWENGVFLVLTGFFVYCALTLVAHLNIIEWMLLRKWLLIILIDL